MSTTAIEDTKELAKALVEHLSVMRAFIEGETIEVRVRLTEKWETTDRPKWFWDNYEYRIKPKPLEIEAWVHPDGRVFTKKKFLALGHQHGFTLKRFREVIE